MSRLKQKNKHSRVKYDRNPHVPNSKMRLVVNYRIRFILNSKKNEINHKTIRRLWKINKRVATTQKQWDNLKMIWTFPVPQALELTPCSRVPVSSRSWYNTTQFYTSWLYRTEATSRVSHAAPGNSKFKNRIFEFSKIETQWAFGKSVNHAFPSNLPCLFCPSNVRGPAVGEGQNLEVGIVKKT